MRLIKFAAAAIVAAVTMAAAVPSMAYEQRAPEQRTSFFGLFGRPSDFGNGPKRGYSSSSIKRQLVSYSGRYAPGTIVVNTAERRLYLVQDGGVALRYGIGVGRDGFRWSGVKSITRKAEWPGWTPPPLMRKRQPGLPAYLPGGIEIPLGARALYLGSSLYRIHGSNEPHTIGQAVSSGCFPMTNEDVMDLYERVRVGTRVVVL